MQQSLATNSMPIWQPRAAEAGNTFAAAVLVSLLLLSVPIKNFAYLLPPVFLSILLLSGETRVVWRTVLWGAALVYVSLVSLLFETFVGSDVNVPGLFVGALTYAPLALMLGLRTRLTISDEKRQQITLAVALFVIIQSLIGLAQYAASGNPDSVAGTFALLDFRSGEYTMGQVFLSFNLYAMVMYLLTDSKTLLAKAAIVVGLLACAVAHSGHQTLFLIASLAVVALVQMRARHMALLGGMLTILVLLTATVSTIYWEHMASWYERVLHSERSPKKDVTFAAMSVMSSPKNMLFGVGMGQFSSRAALITSGEYLQRELPAALVSQSGYYRQHVRPANFDALAYGEGSIMTKPYYSVLNLGVEFGLPVLLLMGWIAAREFRQNRRLATATQRRSQMVGILANVGLVFFVLCCFIENYIELPQAVFLPILLYVVARAAIKSSIVVPEGKS